MAEFSLQHSREDRAFVILCLFLLLVVFTGGGSRADIQSLAILRPVAIAMTAFGLLTLGRKHLQDYKALLVGAAVIFIVAALYLVPLPPAIWGILPSHAVVLEVDRLAGLGSVWRPLALAPDEAWNSVMSLFVPLGVLLVGVQIGPQRHVHLAWFAAALIMLSAIVAGLQLVSPGTSALYPYRITNDGMAVGLFANRNHQATMLSCLLLLLMAFVSTGSKVFRHYQIRAIIAFVVGGLFVIPLILVTGSRAGVLTMVVALALCPLLYVGPAMLARGRTAVLRISRSWAFAAMAGAVVFAIVATLMLGSSTPGIALFQSRLSGDLRVSLWTSAIDMMGTYMPFGSGPGSFVDVYNIYERQSQLSPQYANHVHNDWLEIVLTTGIFGILALVVAVVAWVRRALAVLQGGRTNTGLLHRLGLGLVLIIAIASFVDYPIRVPMVASLLALAAIWACMARSPDQNRSVQ